MIVKNGYLCDASVVVVVVVVVVRKSVFVEYGCEWWEKKAKKVK